MAMGVNKNRVVRKTRSFNNLTLLSVACPVCMGILIEPVTLPCNHELCLECFEKTVENNSLTCPMCRKRIGGWLRKAKDRSLVNETLWNIIQEKFPNEVEAKLRGDDDGVSDGLSAMIPPVSLSTGGEIREEFELERKRYEDEIRRKQEEEQRASLALIKKLQEEENQKKLETSVLIKEDEEIARKVQESVKEEEILEAQRLKRRQEEDEMLARKLQEVLMENSEAKKVKSEKKDNKVYPSTSSITPIKGPMDSFVYQVKQNISGEGSGNELKLKIERKEKRSRSQSNDSINSTDSINQEFVHFKPIRIVPRTPPKKMPDGRVFEPRVVKASPLRITDISQAVTKGSNLNPAVRKLAENIKMPNLAITPPSKGKISNLFGSSQSSAFRAKDFVRKLDPYDLHDQAELSSEPQRKKLCVESKGLSHNYEQPQKHSAKAIQHTNKSEFSTFVSSLDTTLSPIEMCRSAGEDDITGIAHIGDSYSVGCESPAKTSTDSGKISLCEEDSSKIHLSDEVCKTNVDNEKEGNEALFYRNDENDSNSLNNNNVEMGLESRDYAICDSGIEDERTITEQARLEQMIHQEQEDMRLAMELQRKFDMERKVVDRRKGTSRAYELRNTSVSETIGKPTKRVVDKSGRQRTLEETFHSGNQRLVANTGH